MAAAATLTVRLGELSDGMRVAWHQRSVAPVMGGFWRRFPESMISDKPLTWFCRGRERGRGASSRFGHRVTGHNVAVRN